jgi:hypothetical protein
MEASGKGKGHDEDSTNLAASVIPAGAPIPQSGIYVLQHTCSRPPQQVVGVTGDRLRACPEL